MSVKRPESISSMLKESRNIRNKDIVAIRERLREAIRWPSIRAKLPLRGKTQTALTLPVTEFGLPSLDLFNGAVEGISPERANPPIVVSFPGPDGPIFVPATYDPRTPAIECSVPANALSGELEILIPVSESYGTRTELEGLAEYLKIDLETILPSSHGTDICPPLPEPPSCLRDIFWWRWRWRVAVEASAHIDYERIRVGSFLVGCSTCFVGCTRGAISLDDDGICSVNPEICLGQRFTIDRSQFELTSDNRQVYKRFEEVPCWRCFVGNEQYSEKCPRHVLRRALHHNGVCCGSCSTYSRVLGLTLKELCSHGAIQVDGGGFTVNKNSCIGCGTCYHGINCANNVGPGQPLCCSGDCPSNTNGNTTIRLVSYAEHSAT
ncbi:MAG: hypothetical protein ACYTAN_09530 [Planctomycetota bacterium]|jgi:Fe-S-cluster-containing hydrogenase component 2